MRVLQLIDSLEVGGAERMAVSLANVLAETPNNVSFLCATRVEGLLKATLNDEVKYLFLRKRNKFDLAALKRLKHYCIKHKIDIIHAHSSSFFFGYLLKLSGLNVKLIWHDHYGNSEHLINRPRSILRFCSRKFDLILAVNEPLKQWAEIHLKCKKVSYARNFVKPVPSNVNAIKLKDSTSFKIVCLANLRPQKDHSNLLHAFKVVQKQYPNSSLHCIGKIVDEDYHQNLTKLVANLELEQVYFYGEQSGVMEILKQANIGVLSSNSEGLPVALLEYGMSGLPVVCTEVGQCAEVVKDFGIIVPKEHPEALAKAMITYIEDADVRQQNAAAFQQHIKQNYSQESTIQTLLFLYQSIL